MGGAIVLVIIAVFAIAFAFLFIAALTRYKRCPSDKILVIYGKVGEDKSSKCVHGGAAFVWPVIQASEWLDLSPMGIELDLKGALSKQNIRINVPASFTIGVSTEPSVMQNAAERLLGKKINEIQELARDIIFGQLRVVVATMDIEEINADRDKFIKNVTESVGDELAKVGLKLINVNVRDITDESGYIDALGKEAAAKAINEAKVEVAQHDRSGATGEATADRDKRIQIAEADAEAIRGENDAKAAIAKSNADLSEREAEAGRRATAARQVADARAQQESYAAEREAQQSLAAREEARLHAEQVVPAEAEKQQTIVAAQAEAERQRERARGEADAIYSVKEAEARGLNAILEQTAAGLKSIVAAAGGDPDKAVQLIVANKIEELLATQMGAIKDLKFDKVTVWDSGNGNGSTADFIQSLYKAVPPLKDVLDSHGVSLPEWVAGKSNGSGGPPAPKGAPSPAKAEPARTEPVQSAPAGPAPATPEPPEPSEPPEPEEPRSSAPRPGPWES
jgi:flotillin